MHQYSNDTAASVWHIETTSLLGINPTLARYRYPYHTMVGKILYGIYACEIVKQVPNIALNSYVVLEQPPYLQRWHVSDAVSSTYR